MLDMNTNSEVRKDGGLDVQVIELVIELVIVLVLA